MTSTLDRPATESLWTGPRAVVTVSVFALVSVLAFEQIAVGTAMPRVAAQLDGIALYGIAFAAPAAAAVIAMTVAGTWNDRSGPAVPLGCGTALVTAGLVVAGTAHAMLVVALGRAVFGLGAGLILVSMYVLIARVYPADVQARVFTVLTAAWVLPALVGPLLAGWIADTIGWRWVFLAVIPVVLVTAVTLLAAGRAVNDVSGTRDEDPGAPRPATGRRVAWARGAWARGAWARVGWALVAALGVVALTFASDGASGVARVALTVLAGVVVLGAGTRLMPRGVLRGARGLPSVIAQRGLMGAGFIVAESWIPLMFTSHRGWSLSMAGWFLTPSAVAWFGGSWLASRPHRLPSPVALFAGPVLLVAGIGSAALALFEPPGFSVPVPLLVLGWTLAGTGMGLAYPVLSVFTLQRSAEHEQGVNSAALQLNESLMSSLALGVAGVVFAAFAGAAGVAAAAGTEAATRTAPAPSAGLLACFGIAAVLGLLGAVVSRRVGG